LRSCKLVDIFSPNHIELGYLVQGRKEYYSTTFSKSTIETFANKFFSSGIGQNRGGCAVIRAGEHGALTLSSSTGPEWLPPFYSNPSPKVVDPTGAGNTFLGAFCATLRETGDLREASIRGTVAASYALEQFGLPRFSPVSSDSDENWNGSSVSARVDEFRKRLSKESVT
jgi:sugar/nucleoside kinase (ribokinase family)